MTMRIELKTSQALVGRYHQLLAEDWTQETLNGTLMLLDELLAESGLRLVLSVVGRDDDSAEGANELQEYMVPPSATEALREHLEQMNYEIRERRQAVSHTRMSRRDRDTMETVWRSVHHLTFPLCLPGQPPQPIELSGEVGFYNDIRSVLYCCVAMDLVPRLANTKWGNAHKFVIDALNAHAMVFWQRNPSHQHYLRSLLFHATEDMMAEGRELYFAFMATSPEEHVYLTRALAFWDHMMEQEWFEQAAAFALNLYRSAPAQLLDDIRDMVERSYAARYSRPSSKAQS